MLSRIWNFTIYTDYYCVLLSLEMLQCFQSLCINTTCTEQSLLIQATPFSDFKRVFIFLWSIPVYSHTTAFKDRYNANIFSITKNWIEAFFYCHFSITLHLKVVFESCRNIVTLFSTDRTHCFFKTKSGGSQTLTSPIALTLCFIGRTSEHFVAL